VGIDDQGASSMNAEQTNGLYEDFLKTATPNLETRLQYFGSGQEMEAQYLETATLCYRRLPASSIVL